LHSLNLRKFTLKIVDALAVIIKIIIAIVIVVIIIIIIIIKLIKIDCLILKSKIRKYFINTTVIIVVVITVNIMGLKTFIYFLTGM
jgi:hypothetical protein